MGKPGKPVKPRPVPERSCLGKRKFDSFNEALAASRVPVQKMRKGNKERGRRRVGRLEPYKCHYCEGYHFGHPVRRKL